MDQNVSSNEESQPKITLELPENTTKIITDRQDFPRRRILYTIEDKTCPTCHLVFPDMGHLKIHLETHNTEKKYICDVCNEAFKTNITLKRHKDRWHEAKQKLPACELCGKNFFATEMLEHMRSHTGERPFQCFYCKKQLVSKRKVLAHQRYVCKEVETYYEDKEMEMSDDDIKDVLITASERGNFVCRITKRELKRTEQHRCSVCKKKFTSELQLSRHRPIHDDPGEKQKECVTLRPSRINLNRKITLFLFCNLFIKKSSVFFFNLSRRNV